eukprot:1553262-Pyramimonas_sp.AAC.1
MQLRFLQSRLALKIRMTLAAKWTPAGMSDTPALVGPDGTGFASSRRSHSLPPCHASPPRI